MASPKFAFFVCAILVVQSQALPQAPLKNPIVDIAKTVLPELEKAIDKVFSLANDAVDEISEDSETFQKNVVAVAGKALDRVLNVVSLILQDVEKQYDADTVTILECVRTSGDSLKTLLLNFLDNVSKCRLADAKSIVTSAKALLDDAKDIKSKVWAAADKLQECDGDDAADCAVKVVQNVYDILNNIPQSTEDKIDDLLEKAGQFITDLPTCLEPNVPVLKEDLRKLVDTVSACARA